MSYTTLTLWNPILPLATQEEVQQHALQMAEQGKTDAVKIITPVEAGMMATRTWTTLADAEEWKTYITQFNPVSVEIVPPTP